MILYPDAESLGFTYTDLHHLRFRLHEGDEMACEQLKVRFTEIVNAIRNRRDDAFIRSGGSGS